MAGGCSMLHRFLLCNITGPVSFSFDLQNLLCKIGLLSVLCLIVNAMAYGLVLGRVWLVATPCRGLGTRLLRCRNLTMVIQFIFAAKTCCSCGGRFHHHTFGEATTSAPQQQVPSKRALNSKLFHLFVDVVGCLLPKVSSVGARNN